MLQRYYVRPDTADRVRSSWIAEAIEKYVRCLSDRHYTARTVLRRIPVLVRFGQFAQDRGATKLKQLCDHVEPFVQQWVQARVKARATASQRKKVGEVVRNPIQQMLRLAVPGFIGLGRVHRPENPFQREAPHFLEYLRDERGLKEETIRQYQHHLRRFAAYLQRIGLRNLAALTPAVLSGFAADYSRRVGWVCVRNSVGSLRVFLRYLYRERLIAKDLAGAIEYPQSFRLSGVPRSITWDQVRQVLEQVDRRTPTGKRDYAILLLLVTYGLRAREVAALTLDDLDWRNDRLQVPQRKAGHSTAYPLSAVVGEAIIDYLKNGRPQLPDRRVFYSSQAPLVPINSAAISGRAAHYLRKADIQVPRPGSHTLRHTCVQRLVDSDFSLKSIGDYVGHRNPSSTQIYGKVAIEALRSVALGDGEEVL